ncbi:hypothetical protein [Conexibacter sp. SYSU D00693]|uniref:hypothetical protein n=1 Tax=Conexibacter sp. SYSU D00693 TaxID=2812560 RepID=UPI00196A3E52|nr:hypothetical protein [Conexibacter sp. SYSU D00693]
MRVIKGAAGAALTIAAVVAAATPAGAAITEPTAGQVVRGGDVVIKESVGATGGTLCAGATSTVKVTRVSDGAVVHTASKAGTILAPNTGAWQTTWNAEGQPGGSYRITSTSLNRPRSGFSCQSQTVTLSDITVTVKPWQHKFVAFDKRSTVFLNTEGGVEWQATVDGQAGAAYAAPGATVLDDRFVALHENQGADGVTGIFDTKTRSFTGLVKTRGRTVPAFSSGGADLGGQQLADSLRGQLTALATEAGLDPAALFALKLGVRVPGAPGKTDGVDLSVEDGLSLLENTPDPAGVSLTPTALSAGVVTHFYLNIGAGSQLAYRISDTGLAVPSLEVPNQPLLALLGGANVIQVKGGPFQTGRHAVGTTAVATVDTTPGAPGGLVWLPVEGHAGLVKDTAIDFLGQGVATQGEQCVLGICIASGAVIGIGAAQYNGSPVPLPALGTLTSGVPGFSNVVAAINGATGQLTGSIPALPQG